MNLKEAFRYQNKLQRLMEEAQEVLARERNVTKVENTALRHKVCSEAEDETTVEMPETEYIARSDLRFRICLVNLPFKRTAEAANSTHKK